MNTLGLFECGLYPIIYAGLVFDFQSMYENYGKTIIAAMLYDSNEAICYSYNINY